MRSCLYWTWALNSHSTRSIYLSLTWLWRINMRTLFQQSFNMKGLLKIFKKICSIFKRFFKRWEEALCLNSPKCLVCLIKKSLVAIRIGDNNKCECQQEQEIDTCGERMQMKAVAGPFSLQQCFAQFMSETLSAAIFNQSLFIKFQYCFNQQY